MEKLKSKIRSDSDEFKNRIANYRAILTSYREILRNTINRDKDEKTAKHLSRNKLLVRDRINLLVDTDTPFLELSPLAACEMYNNEFPSAGIVFGY